MARTCECRWHLVEENKHAIRISIYRDGSRPIWLGKKHLKIAKRDEGLITFTLDYSEAKKRGMI